MPLTDTAIRNAKPGITPAGKPTDKPYKLADAGGLYLEVSPKGGKYWRLKYRFEGKEKSKDSLPMPSGTRCGLPTTGRNTWRSAGR
ncbi:Arm DNA-binding domain-containing protein [Methylomagnum ishizawai]|uniref:Arm DNA-binding domain-containing protein n=1 Tax=Methylomagnum ishizawai TaxID=1760988 RepID=UPI001594AC5B|nr:Arm DNA-binding domain-containing protein [Methylomagnum ishizawai]